MYIVSRSIYNEDDKHKNQYTLIEWWLYWVFIRTLVNNILYSIKAETYVFNNINIKAEYLNFLKATYYIDTICLALLLYLNFVGNCYWFRLLLYELSLITTIFKYLSSLQWICGQFIYDNDFFQKFSKNSIIKYIICILWHGLDMLLLKLMWLNIFCNI